MILPGVPHGDERRSHRVGLVLPPVHRLHLIDGRLVQRHPGPLRLPTHMAAPASASGVSPIAVPVGERVLGEPFGPARPFFRPARPGCTLRWRTQAAAPAPFSTIVGSHPT
ncbi:hypothetical protein ETD86_39375 [Nonomuraea turkmeniaca]|uniref:Uncharacterized protein n=1 Tax=Nonomuraea turkmeniaca TaxID=103838 RepID=A0A5S4F3I4_9ACTN|nr:hypothetical protein ETD86_39375 [Nonomuraea turkmeniaca]